MEDKNLQIRENKNLENKQYKFFSESVDKLIFLQKDITKLNENFLPFHESNGNFIKLFKTNNKILNESIYHLVKAINPTKKAMEMIIKSMRSITNQIVDTIPNITTYFVDLSKTVEELQKDPDSVFNWIEFAKTLSSYFWLPPYEMESSQLMKLLKSVNNEKQLDEELEKYFTNQIIENLFNEIIIRSFLRHKEIIKQIKKAYDSESYALANTGLFSIIDSLCGFFVVDKKKNTYRINLFEPILKIEKRKSRNYYNVLVLSMVNANINFLYGEKNKTHKIARRHPSQHGEFFSNNKIDTIMLLHTIYYLLLLTDVYKKYEKSLTLKVRHTEKKIIQYILIKKQK